MKWRNFKQYIFGKNGLSKIGLTNIIGGGTTSIFWFYLASLIEPEQYGQIHYFIGIAGMSQLLSLVTSNNILTVYAAKNIKIHPTLFLISILAGLVALVTTFLLFNKIEVSFLILGYIIFELSNGLLLGRKLFSIYAKFFLIQKFLTLVLGISLYHIFGVEGVLFALVLSYIPYILIIFREFKENKIDFSLLKSRKGFLINNYGINISVATGGQIDKLIIVPLLGFGLLGNYSLAMQVIVVLMILPNIIFKFLLAQDSSGENTEKLKIYTILLSIGLSITGVFVLPQIITIIFPKFVDVVSAIQIMSIVIIPATIGLLFESKFLALEKSRYVIISKILGLGVIITGFIILGTAFGIVGLSISLVLSSFCSASYLFIVDKKILK